MKLREAIHIVENIDSDAIDDVEKGLAILRIKNAETLSCSRCGGDCKGCYTAKAIEIVEEVGGMNV